MCQQPTPVGSPVRMLFSIQTPNDVVWIRKLYAKLSDPSADVIEKLARFCGCEAPSEFVIRSAMRTLLSAVSLAKPPNPGWQCAWTFVPVPDDGPYTNTKPTGFRIGCWQCDVDDWCELVHYVCEILYLEHPDMFRECAFKVTGRRRDYFSAERERLGQPKKVCSGLWVETRLSANNSVSFVNELAQVFGYEKPEIRYLSVSVLSVT
jgi:hypothetical protein